jgi:hypothetical protein
MRNQLWDQVCNTRHAVATRGPAALDTHCVWATCTANARSCNQTQLLLLPVEYLRSTTELYSTSSCSQSHDQIAFQIVDYLWCDPQSLQRPVQCIPALVRDDVEHSARPAHATRAASPTAAVRCCITR